MMNVKSKKKINQQDSGATASGKPSGATRFQENGNTIHSPKRIVPKKKWCFTWNNYTEDDISSLVTHKGFQGSKQYMFQQEIGESGTPHLQGFIVFHKKIRWTSLKLSKKIHWEKMKGSVVENIKYCSDEEKRAPGGKCYYHGCKPFKPLITIKREDFYDWENELLEIVQNCVDNRAIHWVYETVGKVGKSQFCRWLAVHEQAVICDGGPKDMKFMISQRLGRGDSTDLIIFDIPKELLSKVSYAGIEQIKNGLFCSPKYESCMTIMNQPTVLIFANAKPRIEKMSLDRWHIYEIGLDRKLIHCDTMSSDIPEGMPHIGSADPLVLAKPVPVLPAVNPSRCARLNINNNNIEDNSESYNLLTDEVRLFFN